MKKLIFIFLSLLITAWIAGCSENDCPLNSNSMNQVAFFDSKTGEAVSLLDTLTVTAIGTDSVLINRETNASILSLPLNYKEDETCYIFTYTGARYDTIPLTADKDTIIKSIVVSRDTIGIFHTNRQHFLSVDCGLMNYFHLDSVWSTHHLIDSTRIIDADINEYEKTNIKIYLASDD